MFSQGRTPLDKKKEHYKTNICPSELCTHFEHDIKSNFFCSLPEDEELGGFQGVAMECDPSYYQWYKDAAVHPDSRGKWKKTGEMKDIFENLWQVSLKSITAMSTTG